MPSNSGSWIFLVILLASNLTLAIYRFKLHQAVKQLPRIDSSACSEKSSLKSFPKTSIIIPAFNEEDNIEECIYSVLASTELSVEQLEVWVIDDQSTDRTAEILKDLQIQLADSRLKVLSGQPKPENQIWIGKNWACHQGVEQADGKFLLLIDADVRLQPNAISAVVQAAIDRQLDFLTCIPTIVSGSLIEWLVQPLMFMNVLVSFNAEIVKDPSTKTTFALGPFLLFRAAAYHRIGGHRAVAAHVAEDVALARKLKCEKLRLQHVLGTSLATLRMYRNWQSLWEGWTKVLYVGAERNLLVMILLIVTMLLLYTVPWIGAIAVIFSIFNGLTVVHYIELGLVGLAILLQYQIRRQGSQALGTLAKYWWLQSVGGLLVAVLAIASIIKAETGWGWTWRGRKLTSAK